MVSGWAQDGLLLLMTAIQGTWAVRVWKCGLLRRYPILFAYLSATTFVCLISYLLTNSGVRVWGHDGYYWFWVLVRPVLWALFFLLIFEVYSRMLEGYAGVRRLGQLVMYGALGSVATVVTLLVYADPYPRADLGRLRALWLIQEQSVYLAIAGFAFLLLVFKRFFRLRVCKNVQLVFATFGVYFAGTAGLIVLRSYLGPEFLLLRNFGSGLLYVACLAVGVLQFSRPGETEGVEASLAPEQYGETVALASRQLSSFNDRLVRVLSQ